MLGRRMKKIPFVLALALLLAIFGICEIVMAADGQKTEGDLLIVPGQETGAVSNVIDDQLKGQGLYFTQGSVRPVESGPGLYPVIGDDVILLTLKKEEK